MKIFCKMLADKYYTYAACDLYVKLYEEPNLQMMYMISHNIYRNDKAYLHQHLTYILKRLIIKTVIKTR